MTVSVGQGERCRSARALAAAALLAVAVPAAACELDGLSHGYGPMSALFAGAHRYQSLNGLEDEESPPEPPPPAPEESPVAEGVRPASPATTPPPGAAPPSSFVAWAKAKPKPSGPSSVAEATAPAWTQPSDAKASAGKKPADTER
jgi:hypothetical protein